MTVDDIIAARNIKEVLHFTTNRGITGMIATGRVLSRERLPDEKHLEHVYQCNCPDRSRDANWHDYVNLSITTVNRRLFGISKGKWDSAGDGWWCIASFVPEIMTHEGVQFTTTNNMYSGVRRYTDPDGLEKLFGPQICQWENKAVTRTPSCPPNQPTCGQAEVLYPGELSLDYLQRLYVKTPDDAAALESILSLYPRDIEVVEQPELF